MNKMTILIKGKVNEAKRKVIHKLGGYDEFDMHLALNEPKPAIITHLDLQPLRYQLNISKERIGNVSEEELKREVCWRLAGYLSGNLEEFTNFNLCGPVEPYFDRYCLTGEINVVRTEKGGTINFENYHGPALRKETDDEEVDRGGDPQP